MDCRKLYCVVSLVNKYLILSSDLVPTDNARSASRSEHVDIVVLTFSARSFYELNSFGLDVVDHRLGHDVEQRVEVDCP